MLGSVHDADDALQETLVRAWRGAAGLRERSSARSWLYTIATNVCLTELERRKRRVLPHDLGPAAEGHTPPGEPAVESTWLEPYPDEAMGVPAGRAAPEASYDQREAVELAFVAATQHLAANQRAVLMLREVLGFSAQETATMLDTSVPSVNSALQRARAAVEERVPERTQQATLRSVGDRGLRKLIDRYVEAWERCDVPAFAGLLAEDATFAMPPLGTWYAPARHNRHVGDAVPHVGPVALARRSSPAPTPSRRWPSTRGTSPRAPTCPFALNVLTLRDDALVTDVTAFIVRAQGAPDMADYRNYPEQPIDERQLAGTFGRFGVPDRLN